MGKLQHRRWSIIFRAEVTQHNWPPAGERLRVAAIGEPSTELLVEAEFYGMQSFARALCAPELDLTQHLDAAALAERDEEARIRAADALRQPLAGDEGLVCII